jgi:hypothetical protein
MSRGQRKGQPEFVLSQVPKCKGPGAPTIFVELASRDMFVGKTAVHGVLDRELRQVRAKVLPYITRKRMQKEILDNVRPRLPRCTPIILTATTCSKRA